MVLVDCWEIEKCGGFEVGGDSVLELFVCVCGVL